MIFFEYQKEEILVWEKFWIHEKSAIVIIEMYSLSSTAHRI